MTDNLPAKVKPPLQGAVLHADEVFMGEVVKDGVRYALIAKPKPPPLGPEHFNCRCISAPMKHVN